MSLRNGSGKSAVELTLRSIASNRDFVLYEAETIRPVLDKYIDDDKEATP